MRVRWGVLLAGLLLAVALAYAIAAIRADPVREHAFFGRAPAYPLVIAHRGGMHLWPENTLYAFEQAAALGADVLEMDLRATADGVIVVLHDVTVNRTTDGHGDVRDFTLDSLRALDAGYAWSPLGARDHPHRGQGLRIPTLEEVFSELPATRLNLEIKQAEPSLVPQLCELVRRHRAQERVLVASFREAVVHEFRRACPGVATSATASEARAFVAAKLLPAPPFVPSAAALQLPTRLGPVPVVTRPLLRAARRANLPVHAFTVNDPDSMRLLLDRGVDGIVTDRPDLMLRLLGRRP
jgi:glycerophosphoryl diester phosphodiesterase